VDVAQNKSLCSAMPYSFTEDERRTYMYVAAASGIQQYEVNGSDGSIRSKGETTQYGYSTVLVTPDGSQAYGQGPGTFAPFTYTINAAGDLYNTYKYPSVGGFSSTSMAMSPDGKFIYYANQAYTIGTTSAPPQLIAYAVRPGGQSLSPIGSPIALASGTLPNRLIVHPSGSWLYMATDSGSLVQYLINADGSLTAPATFAAGKGASSMSFTPDGKFLYVANKTDQTLSIFQVVSTGALNPVGAPVKFSTAGYTIASVAVAPNGKTLFYTYTALFGTSYYNYLSSSGIKSDGTLGDLNYSSTSIDSTNLGAINIAFDPTGRYLYVATSHGVFMEQIDPATNAPLSDPLRATSSMESTTWISFTRK
jgi:6-phosphogluconolactonase